MKRILATAVAGAALALPLSLVAAAPAAAAPSAKGACVQAGLGTLKDLGLLQAAAQKKVNYADLDPTGSSPLAGAITVELGDEFYAPLGQVVKLHTTNPEYFTWCG